MNKPGWLVSQFAFLTLRELVNLTLRDGSVLLVDM